jgi:hypothetical protein
MSKEQPVTGSPVRRLVGRLRHLPRTGTKKLLNLNSKVGSPEFSEDNLRKKLDALIVENSELKLSHDVLLSNADKIREQLAARVRFLECEYAALHSQVSGYLHGDDWKHWQKFNAARFNPPNAERSLDAPGDQSAGKDGDARSSESTC